MTRILLIDNEPIVCEPIAASVRSRGHQVTCAHDAREAMMQLQMQTPDLIVLDIDMPGQNGLALLRQLKAAESTAAIPVLFLTNVTERSVILEAIQLGAQGYLLKVSFSLEGFHRQITKLCGSGFRTCRPPRRVCDTDEPASKEQPGSPSTALQNAASSAAGLHSPPAVGDWPRLLTSEQTIARVDSVAETRTLAGVVYSLISTANSPNADLSDVVRVIESDPVLAARVLQIANGAAAATRGHVRNVRDAARNLGVRALQDLAITIGVVEAFPPDQKDGFNVMRCWQHSYAVANFLTLLAGSCKPDELGVYHLIGLCHDLGEILLRQSFAEEYEQIVQFATAHQLPVSSVQTTALCVRPPDLITRLLTRIALPEPIVKTIHDYFEWQIRPDSVELNPTLHSLHLANLYAHGLLLAPSNHETLQPLTLAEWHRFNGDKPVPEINPAKSRNDILTATNMLARLPAKEEQRFLMPLIPRRDLRIWYQRPASLAELDPIAFALSICTKVSISQELPQGDQWRHLDGMIIVGNRPGVSPVVPQELQSASAGAGRPDLPILGLVSHENVCESNQSLSLRSYPISIHDLDNWLANLRN